MEYSLQDLQNWWGTGKTDAETAAAAAQRGMTVQDVQSNLDRLAGHQVNSVANWVDNKDNGYHVADSGAIQKNPANGFTGARMATMPAYQKSPYLDQMFSSIEQQGTQNLNQNIMPNIRYGAQAAGGFGDSRQGIAEGNAIAQTQSAIAGQKAQAGQNDYNTFNSNALQKYGVDSNFSMGNAQMANSYNLGMGNLGLINKQADQNFALGVGNLGLNTQNSNQNFYTNQRGQDLSAIGLGASLTNQGNAGNLGIGQGISSIGNTQQQAPWTVINNANGVFGPYRDSGRGATSTESGSVAGGITGGALAGSQLAKLWGNGSNLGMGSSWSTGGGQWNNPSARGGSQGYMLDNGNYAPTY